MKYEKCLGERYIGCGSSDKKIYLEGTPGNALGAYLEGAEIILKGNAQDATGDTMNCGRIIIHGNTGDTVGYAMRGGEIYVKGNAGYRAGIHMKAYKDKLPVLVIGSRAGSFLGEYQAGGVIIVLGIGSEDKCPLGFFCAAGMHGGKIFLRTEFLPVDIPPQIEVREADDNDKKEIKEYIKNYCRYFSEDEEKILDSKFYVLMPNSKNPYKKLYVNN